MAINSTYSYHPKYSLDGKYIYYENISDGTKLYKKSANDSSNGVAVGSFALNTNKFDISPDGKSIVYENHADGERIYKKSADDNLDGSAITTGGGWGYVSYSPDGKYIIYGMDMKRKLASDSLDGVSIISGSFLVRDAIYSPD